MQCLQHSKSCLDSPVLQTFLEDYFSSLLDKQSCWTQTAEKKKKTAAIFRQIFLQNIFPSEDRWIRGQENFSLYSRLKKQPQAAR